MKNRKWLMAVAIMLIAILGYAGCGVKKAKTGSSAPGSVSGRVVDADGQPIEGALVVFGTSSPHTLTDQNGQFNVTDVSAGSQPMKVIAGGFYTPNASANIEGDTGNDMGDVQAKEVGEGLDNAPHINNVSAVISGSSISVSAIITKGAGNDEVTDARAELLYYNTGCVLANTNGNQYSGTILIPANAVGPNLTVVIFAVDAQNMTASEAITVAYSGGSGSGGFTLDTISGTWSGSIKFHRDEPDANNQRRVIRNWTNAVIDVAGATVTGQYAEPRLWLLTHGYSDPIETINLNSGSATLVDASIGLYKIELSYTGVSRTGTIELTARCDSAANPANIFGMMHAVEIDNAMAVTNYFSGGFHFKKGESWSLADLTSSWTLADFFITGTAFSPVYKPPFQYNEAFSVDASGTVIQGSNSMGLDITGGSFAVSDAALGKFTGSILTTDGVSTSFYGLVNLGKNHIKGIKKIAGTGTVYGHFWGPKTPQPLFSNSDFASRRPGGNRVNSVFTGAIFVTSGPDADRILPAKLLFDQSGNIVGGCVYPSIPVISSGSAGFVNTTTGQLSGSARGLDGYTFTMAPTSSQRNASMGVYKARLVGDFILTTSVGVDSGYFFMHRRPE